MITASEEQKPEMSIEEAIEKAEIIFEDTTIQEPPTETKDVNTEMKVDVTPTISVPETITKRVSPRLKEIQIVDSDAKLAEELSKNPSPTPPTHNLRPKRTLRHVQALKQQAKRRKRNTGLANASSGTQRVFSAAKKSTFNSNGDIEIHYKPTSTKTLSELHTMKDVLTSISGFNMGKLRRSNKLSKKSSISAAIQMANEGSIDLETPDSILSQVNLRTLLNKTTFLKLPPEYQYKLSLLLPRVDFKPDLPAESSGGGSKLNHSSFNNEFFAKSIQEWKERLLRGDFTLENLTKAKADIERDKQKTDPWKIQNFEPVWGIKKGFMKEEFETESEEKITTRSSRASSRKLLEVAVSSEDEPLLKKVKAEAAAVPEAPMPPMIIVEDEVDTDNAGPKEVTEETVIEEPVNLMEEQDSISEPPLRSCSIDFEEISIPSPAIATPIETPPMVTTPAPTASSSASVASTASEPVPAATPPIAVMVNSPASVVVNSPASVRSVRGNSITFSSSRSPSPAASLASSSTQEEAEEPMEIDPSVLQTKTVIKPPKTNRTNPTAIINKVRPPQGDVNLERSLEIVRTAVEKSVVNQQIMRAPMIIRPVTSQRPTVQPSSAVLVTTTDGKTLLAHPANQILRPVGPAGVGSNPVRVRLPTATAAKVTPIVAVSQPNRPATVQQVVQIVQSPQQKQPVFRMPTTTSTMVLDSSQINTFIVSLFQAERKRSSEARSP